MGVRGFRVGREFGDCDEGWIYPGGGSELHFPGHEWQINKQFAFVGNGRQWGEKQPPARTQTPRGDPSENCRAAPLPRSIYPLSNTHTHTLPSPRTYTPATGLLRHTRWIIILYCISGNY